MSAEAWVAIAALTFLVVVQAGASIWWAATVNSKVAALEAAAKSHGDLRDIVIEMRTEMRGFQGVIRDLAEGIKDLRRPTRRGQEG
jgi:hypothetical protein